MFVEVSNNTIVGASKGNATVCKNKWVSVLRDNFTVAGSPSVGNDWVVC